MIRYLANTEIDRVKWDSCVERASNGIIFAYSWYLDSVCEQWDALVKDDYEVIMPLPFRNKWGISYIYTPFFLNQLGVFSEQSVTVKMVDDFLATIPSNFRYIDLCLNESNVISKNDFRVERRAIQYIDLNKSYEQIQQDYSENLKRNLRKAEKNSLQTPLNVQPEIVLSIFRNAQGEKLEVFKKKDYVHLVGLMNTLIQKGVGETIGVYSSKGTLLAAACFMKSHRRIIYLKGAANEEGKTIGAMHFLIDKYIRQNAGKKLIFDFGGSSVASVARFNNSFGSKEAVYLRLQRNNLPKFVRWIKK